MKYSSIRFLSKANIKGNKNSIGITVLVCLLVSAITLISSFASTTVNAVNEYKEDYRARALELDPWTNPLTNNAVKAISGIEHVQSVNDITGLRGINIFNLLDIKSQQNDCKALKKQLKSKESSIFIEGLMEDEKKSVIAGKGLEDSPMYSCIVPSLFYPFEDEGNTYYENLDYIDGTKLIGKTITIKGYNDNISLLYNYINSEGECIDGCASLPSPKIKLKVVGVYYCSPTAYGNFANIFISRETDLQITQNIMKTAGLDFTDNSNDLVKWWNTPSLHSYFVVADNCDNLPEVYNSISKMGYEIATSPELLINESTVIMANLLSTVGMFLIFAIGIFAVIVLLQSSISSIKERKGIIGLMKAMGYKNSQIFACFYYEQLYLTIKAFIIGGIISSVFITITNYIFSHKSYKEMLYIIDWHLFINNLSISLALVIVIPLVCQIVILKRLSKIQPKDAMNS